MPVSQWVLPGKARAICVFDASSAADRTAVDKQAAVPFTELVEALGLRPAGPQPEAQTSHQEENPSC